MPEHYQFSFKKERFDDIYDSYMTTPENRISMARYQALTLYIAKEIVEIYTNIFDHTSFIFCLGSVDIDRIIRGCKEMRG